MLLALHIALISSTTLSFDLVHSNTINQQVLSADSHVTIDTIHQTQPACCGYDDTIVGMRFDQRLY